MLGKFPIICFPSPSILTMLLYFGEVQLSINLVGEGRHVSVIGVRS